ncbi:hypothetical protein [Spongiactinospora rosea]|nr:hypothetical protein [Spongiactinospora rosea]
MSERALEYVSEAYASMRGGEGDGVAERGSGVRRRRVRPLQAVGEAVV